MDTLYYSISIDESGLKSEGSSNSVAVNCMLERLKKLRELAKANPNEEQKFHDLTVKLVRFATYDLCISDPDLYDVFIASALLNDSTPRIVVQIRTKMLVLLGPKEAVRRSLVKMNEILSAWKLQAVRVDENRIDYAYHTNLIQNPSLFFSDEELLLHAKTRLKRYQKSGYLDTELTIDYLALGARKSDDVFVRIYLKDQEVIEQAYKPFFIERWYQDGLISFYDKYCFEQAYKMRCYRTGLLVGRISFYLEYGHDEKKKEELRELLKKCHVNSDNSPFIEKSIKGFLPQTTKIVNIEYQTKRRFYHYFANEIKAFKYTHDSAAYGGLTERLFRVLEMRSAFLEYLTRFGGTLSFVHNRNATLKDADVQSQYMSWWKALRRCRISDTPRYSGLVRSSTQRLDRDRTVLRNMNDMASFAIISTGSIEERSLSEDAADLLCAFVNDNDMRVPQDLDMMFVRRSTGEEVVVPIRSEKYTQVRVRKARKLKPLLNVK